MIKPDKWIIAMATQNGMIEPFVRENVKQIDGQKILSYGTQPYGYDLRLAPEFKIPKRNGILDVKRREFEEVSDRNPVIPPNDYIIGYTMETVRMPDNITGLIYGKSSLAEAGILVNATPVDAGFEGQLRLCIVNLNHVPVKLYAGEGIAQMLFFEGDGHPLKNYKQKGGNYV